MVNRFRIGLSRRRFLLSSAMGSVTLPLFGCPTAAGNIIELNHPLIIGSGFGGSITAHRMTEQGIPVTLLERGRRWPITPEGNTFCSMRETDERAAWFSRSSHIGLTVRGLPLFAGIVEQIVGDNIDINVGAGVGGGSLVYAGMMLQVPRNLFVSAFPAGISYDDMLNTWYPKVASVMTMARIPDDILQSPTYSAARTFIDHATRAGLDLEFNLQAVDWNLIREEMMGMRPAEATAGDYIYGLNSGAKGSVDQTYLAYAERTGLCDVKPLHQVTRVASDLGGGYRVDCERIDEQGNVLERITYRAPVLVMSAGAVHTTRMLVEARARGDMPNLPAQVGEGWGQNGQHIFMRGGLTEATGTAQGGPPFVVIRDLDNPIAPVTMEYGAAPFPLESHTLVCPVSSIQDGFGRIRYDAMLDRGVVEWDPASTANARMAGEHTGTRLNMAAGGMNQPLIGRRRESTFHPLGGCVIGSATDLFGRVNGMRGLYVLDGALMPGATPTCNPAWTISAITERALDTILREDFV